MYVCMYVCAYVCVYCIAMYVLICLVGNGMYLYVVVLYFYVLVCSSM